jgi:hypothetical protein
MTAIGRRTADGGGAATEGWPQRGAKGARIGWDGENQTTDNEGRRRVGRRRTDGRRRGAGGLAAKKRKRRKNRTGRRRAGGKGQMTDGGDQTTDNGGQTVEAWRRRVGRKEAQTAQESDWTAEDGWRTLGGYIGREEVHKSQNTYQADNRGFVCATAEREMW